MSVKELLKQPYKDSKTLLHYINNIERNLDFVETDEFSWKDQPEKDLMGYVEWLEKIQLRAVSRK